MVTWLHGHSPKPYFCVIQKGGLLLYKENKILFISIFYVASFNENLSSQDIPIWISLAKERQLLTLWQKNHQNDILWDFVQPFSRGIESLFQGFKVKDLVHRKSSVDPNFTDSLIYLSQSVSAAWFRYIMGILPWKRGRENGTAWVGKTEFRKMAPPPKHPPFWQITNIQIFTFT